MANVVFSANKRADNGTAVSRRMRRSGRLPGVIYGQGQTISVDLDAHAFAQGIRNATESTIVSIELEGKTHQAFVKDTQRNIMTGAILHVDFYEIDVNKILRARVPLHISGSPVGVRDGGVLETSSHEIEVECLPQDLPERLQVDISELKANQAIHVRDLALGKGVKLLSPGDQVVAVVKFAKAEAAPVVEETPVAPAAKAAK